MGNDNLTTIILLIVLGFLIYYLCKPTNLNETCTINNDKINNDINNKITNNNNNKLTNNNIENNNKKLTNNQPEQFADVNTEQIDLQNNNVQNNNVQNNNLQNNNVQNNNLQNNNVQNNNVQNNNVQNNNLQNNEVLNNEVSNIKVSNNINNDLLNSISNDSLNNINAFEPSDMIGDGANLDEAFKCQKCDIQQDVVKMNDVKKYNAQDFLPKEINDKWFDTDFSQAKNNIQDDKLINTERYVIGINTVGQSLKNPSYDIRGTVANPKFTVSPWNNSTYEADYNIKSLV
jgi:hypothetical protein